MVDLACLVLNTTLHNSYFSSLQQPCIPAGNGGWQRERERELVYRGRTSEEISSE